MPILAFRGKAETVMRFAVPLILSVAITFLRFRENDGELTRLRNRRTYSRFFSENATSVIDYYDGNVYHLDKHDNEDSLVILNYATWDERSMRTRAEYARVATLLAKRVTFVAIDCGDAETLCSRMRHIDAFPQIDFRVPYLEPLLTSLHLDDVFPVSTGIYSDQLYATIDNLRRPLTRLTSVEEVLRFAAENENALIGFFDSSALGGVGSRAYSHFYVAALRLASGVAHTRVERDVTIRSAIVTDRRVAAAFDLALSGDMVYVDHLGFYPIASKTWASNASLLINIVERSYRTPLVDVLVARDYPTRSLQLVTRLRNASVVLVVTTPIRPLERSNQFEIAALRELALEVNNCPVSNARSFFDLPFDESEVPERNRKASRRYDTQLQFVRSARESFTLERTNNALLCSAYRTELRAFIERRLHTTEDEFGGPGRNLAPRCSSNFRCGLSAINVSFFGAEIDRERRRHADEAAARLAERIGELEREFNAREFDASRFGFTLTPRNIPLPVDPHVRSVRFNYFKRLCDEVALSEVDVADQRIEPNTTTTSDANSFGNVRGLACAWNRSVQFLVLDSERHASFFERFDLPPLFRRLQKRDADTDEKRNAHALILDFNDDAYYTMRSAFSPSNLAAFLREFVDSKLARSWRSTSRLPVDVQTPVDPPLNTSLQRHEDALETDGKELRVTEWSSRELLAALRDRRETNLLLLYHSAACGACRTLATTFLAVRHLLELFGLANHVLQGRIDMSVNELPVRFQVPSVPALVLFVGRLDDHGGSLRSVHFAYDAREPVQLDDLFRFVLTHGHFGGLPTSPRIAKTHSVRRPVHGKATKRASKPSRAPSASNKRLVTLLGSATRTTGGRAARERLGGLRFVDLLNTFRRLFSESWCHSTACYQHYELTMRRLVTDSERDWKLHNRRLKLLRDRIAQLAAVTEGPLAGTQLDTHAVSSVLRNLSSNLLALRHEIALFRALHSYFLNELLRRGSDGRAKDDYVSYRNESMLALTRCTWRAWLVA